MSYRYLTTPASGGEYQMVFREIQNPVSTSPLNVVPLDSRSEKLVIDVQLLTGALTVTADVTTRSIGDKMDMLFIADSSDRVVTFSTGFTANGTLTVLDAGVATVSFIFTGSGLWLETGRFISAELS